MLEISIAAAACAALVTAGGSFDRNGYSGTIDTRGGNPLAGRSAWTGTGSKLTVIANLPASALGKSVQFRWRVGFNTP